MNLKLENLKKPSNKKWKRVADYFLYTLPLYSTAIAVCSAVLWDEKTALVITVVINIVIISLKGLTKFTADE
jgi:hypothetical protein